MGMTTDGLSYWQAETEGIELLNLTIGELLDRRAAELSDHEALVYSGYPEYDERLPLLRFVCLIGTFSAEMQEEEGWRPALLQEVIAAGEQISDSQLRERQAAVAPSDSAVLSSPSSMRQGWSPYCLLGSTKEGRSIPYSALIHSRLYRSLVRNIAISSVAFQV